MNTVVQVTPYFPPHLGGTEKVAETLAEGLAEDGPVVVLTSSCAAVGGRGTARVGNLTIRRLVTLELAHLPFMPTLLFHLLRLPRRAVVHVHVAQAYVPEMVWLSSVLRRRSFIAHYHLDVDPSGRLGVLFSAYKRWVLPPMLRAAATVIVLSGEQAGFVQRRFGVAEERIVVMPNAVASDFLHEPGAEPGHGGPFRLLFVGRLAPQKDVALLLRTVAQTTAPVDLVIVGDGEQRAMLEALQGRLGLTNVRMVGAVRGAELREWYRWADAFVITSENEGMPVAVLEAMAGGLPVVATEVPGLADTVGADGLLAPRDPKALAASVDRLATDPALWRDLARRSYARGEQFATSAVLTTLRDAYTAVADRAGAVTESREDPDPGTSDEMPTGVPTLTVSRSTAFAALGVVALATRGLLSLGYYLPWLTAIGGFTVVVGLPAFLVYHADLFGTRAASERLVLSVVAAIGLVMAAGLLANTVLPWLGVGRPLAAVPARNTVEALVVALALVTYRRHPATYRLRLPMLSRKERSVIALSAALPLLAAAGATRLNNGAGGGVTWCMLAGVVALFALMLGWRDRIRSGIVTTGIYCGSLSLLLMTSLRGWYTTGHDIQTEYLVFEITKSLGRWKISSFHDAYNACLSITILPTMMWQWVRVDDPYIYKVFFQLLFALCPVLVYRLARRAGAPAVALIATIFFVGFVTFFQDMPFLNRQEIGFLFLVCCLIILFNVRASSRRRWVLFAAFSVGMVVSHYSTTYVAIAVFGLAWGMRVAAGAVYRLVGRFRPKVAARIRPAIASPPGGYVLGLASIAFLAAAAFAWSVPITHTNQGFTQTVSESVESLHWNVILGTKSSDTSYSIVGGTSISPAQRLADFEASTLASTTRPRRAGIYYPLDHVAPYPTAVAAGPTLPLTALGRALAGVGIDVDSLNSGVRQGSAELLQLLILVGLGVTLLARRKAICPPPELYWLAVASVVVVVVQVLLPPLSVNYGLLRAFQQALLVMSVFVVAGILAPLARFPRSGVVIAGVVALAFLCSSTGMITQAIGGYGPQLHLDNAGDYYNLYYTHPEEIAAVNWLNGVDGTGQGLAAPVQMDGFVANRMQEYTNLDVIADINPLLVRQDSYVLLGYSNLHTGESWEELGGDTVAYRYPVAFLNQTKDLIYSSGGARVYK